MFMTKIGMAMLAPQMAPKSDMARKNSLDGDTSLVNNNVRCDNGKSTIETRTDGNNGDNYSETFINTCLTMVIRTS